MNENHVFIFEGNLESDACSRARVEFLCVWEYLGPRKYTTDWRRVCVCCRDRGNLQLLGFLFFVGVSNFICENIDYPTVILKRWFPTISGDWVSHWEQAMIVRSRGLVVVVVGSGDRGRGMSATMTIEDESSNDKEKKQRRQ